ncbi:MAG: sugar phosphate isomerase/epimerase, partial [Oscillospiraceae bacterium]|nr:sugar phosphate isomerase/epimerase [Oscillospiraceae bacterium]
VVHPIIVRNRQEEWERNMQMYRSFIPAAKKYGVKICLENMFTTANCRKTGRACSNAADACRYIDALNAEAGEDVFGYCYDIGHATLTCQDIYEDIKLLGHRLTVLHIHENDTDKDLHQIPFMNRRTKYELNTNWEEFLQALKEIDYRGPLNLESAGSLTCIPTELIKPMLQFGAAVCGYFRQKLQG